MTRTALTSTPNVGVVSYRLTRHRTVQGFRDGRHLIEDVCDATPELRRVATHCSQAISDPCPICDQEELVVVTFAFGPGLPRSGRVVGSAEDLATLQCRGRPATCYSIEVCRQCWWNHLQESFSVVAEPTYDQK